MEPKPRANVLCRCRWAELREVKLDENIGRRGLEFLTSSGHDVKTARGQELGGAPDEELFKARAVEGRALVTLDRDFGQVLRFPPEKTAGVVILEVGPHATLRAILDRLRDLGMSSPVDLRKPPPRYLAPTLMPLAMSEWP